MIANKNYACQTMSQTTEQKQKTAKSLREHNKNI